MLEVLLLGPTEARMSGADVPLTPLERSVLAVLALSPGVVVSTDRLVDSLWVNRSPAAPRSRVQAIVSTLRRKIGPIVLTRAPGYLLEPGAYRTDLQRLDDELRRSREAGERTEVAVHLRRATRLWRGDALEGVDAPGVGADRARLQELRVALQEETFAAELDLGRHAAVVAELAAALTAHPLRERLAGQLMTALVRSHRQADALRVYQDLRERLADELGSDPSSELRELHAEILRGDGGAAPAVTRSDPPRLALAARPPSQLPASVGYFTGRDAELTVLRELAARPGDEPCVVLVTGLGGLGKTALVVQWAATAGARFTDGHIFVDLHGHEPGRALGPGAALGAALAGLGVARRDIPERRDDRAALYRTLVNSRRILVVADDAGSIEQVLPLVPPAPTSRLVVTSRLRLGWLAAHHAVDPIVLDPLGPGASRELLGVLVGSGRLHDAGAAALLGWCGGYPLTIRAAGARLLTRSGQTLSSFADDLGRAAGESLDDGLHSVRDAILAAYGRLSPAAAYLFDRLGRRTGTGARDYRWAAPVTGPIDHRVRRLLDELVAVNLLIEGGGASFVMHDVVHRFAAERGSDLADRDIVDAWVNDQHALTAPSPASAAS